MKRCIQCNHIETDEALNFCRADGMRLVRHGGAGLELVSSSLNETGTSALTQDLAAMAVSPTTAMPGVPTAPTNVLVTQPVRGTGKLGGVQRRRRLLIAVAGLAFILTMAGGVFYFLTHRNNTAIGSLAVLPFLNVNADQQLEYLTDGITETLIRSLSQLPKLNVKARASVFRYKGKDVSPQAAGAALNVQAILNGRVVQRGELLVLSLELSDTRTENVIWSEQYSRKQTDLVSVQNEIARDVSSKLRVKLADADEQRLSKSYTANAQAYQLYLKGRFYWNKRTVDDLEKALAYFNQAIAQDPDYALAFAGLADTHVLLPFFRKTPLREGTPKARDAAMKALALDGNLAEAHATLGLVNTYEKNYAEAEREFIRALELNPTYATAHQWYGTMLLYLARNEESLGRLQRALELDPLSVIINVNYGLSLFYARRYDEAIVQLKKTLELDNGFAAAHDSLGTVYQAKGRYAEAVEEFAKTQELSGEPQTAGLMRESFANGGWQGFLRAMTGERRPPSLPGSEIAAFYVALGDRENAFAELNNSYEEFGRLLGITPRLDPLRDDPRFAELLRRVGFTQ